MKTKICIECGKEYNKGYKMSYKQWDESKFCSKSCLGKNHFLRPRTEEHNKKIGLVHKGKIVSEDTRKRMSLGQLKRKERDGSTVLLEARAKISKASSLENNHAWIDGMSFEPYPITFNKEFKNLVRLRDNFCCLNCGISEQKHFILFNQKLHIHHIDYNKDNTCLINCCTLCIKCNILANKNRNEWREYYQEKLSKLYNYQYEFLEVRN